MRLSIWPELKETADGVDPVAAIGVQEPVESDALKAAWDHMLEEAARNTLQKDKRINIRISSRDLERIQMRAAREGVPYQTYISSSLHKLVSGRLKEPV